MPNTTTNRIGKWSAIILITIGALYLITGIIGASTMGSFWPPRQVDPYLAIMESLIIVSAPFMIILMLVIHSYANGAKKIFSLAAVSFMILAAGLTTVIQFIRLTVLREENNYTNSTLLSDALLKTDLLAWDLFFGLSMFFSAFVFRGNLATKFIFRTMIASGSLCLVGFFGPTTGVLQFQAAAIIGYTVVFMVTCFALAKFFGKTNMADSTV
jgi:hypothetical protein